MECISNRPISFYKEDLFFLKKFLSYHEIPVSRISITIKYESENVVNFSNMNQLFVYAKYNLIDDIQKITFYNQNLPIMHITKENVKIDLSAFPTSSETYSALKRWFKEKDKFNLYTKKQASVYAVRCFLFGLLFMLINYIPINQIFRSIIYINLILMMLFLLNYPRASNHIYRCKVLNIAFSEKWSNEKFARLKLTHRSGAAPFTKLLVSFIIPSLNTLINIFSQPPPQ